MAVSLAWQWAWLAVRRHTRLCMFKTCFQLGFVLGMSNATVPPIDLWGDYPYRIEVWDSRDQHVAETMALRATAAWPSSVSQALLERPGVIVRLRARRGLWMCFRRWLPAQVVTNRTARPPAPAACWSLCTARWRWNRMFRDNVRMAISKKWSPGLRRGRPPAPARRILLEPPGPPANAEAGIWFMRLAHAGGRTRGSGVSMVTTRSSLHVVA